MRRGDQPRAKEPEPAEKLWLHSQCARVDGDYRHTGHVVVTKAATPWEAAERLVLKLRREGNTKACLGAIQHNVLELGDHSGPIWFWEQNPEGEFSRFDGCRASGEGSYYRGRKETNDGNDVDGDGR